MQDLSARLAFLIPFLTSVTRLEPNPIVVETVGATGADIGEAGEAANEAGVAPESEELNMRKTSTLS
jgi:hypothetical protein